ncbi:MAG: cation:proton antiporter domain-containing protein [Bdellovibrionota bacterium]
MGSLEHILLVAATLMIISVVASKAGSRLGVPALLLFLLIGISVGPHGMAEFTHLAPETAQALGTVALIFILFAGGMDTKVEDVKPVVGPALVLSTVGVVVSTLLIGCFARLYLGFSFVEGCLLGATISSTDVAAVFSVLRSKAVSLKSGIAPLLELESALNDPMAVFLGVALLGLVTHKMESVFHFLPLFVQGVIGQSATNAGVILTPIMFGVIISSVIGSIIKSKTGRYKALALVGLATAAGMFLLCDWVPRDALLARDPPS